MTLNVNFYVASGERHSDMPLVLLHGWAADANCWQQLLPELNKHRDIFTLDLPGFGNSPKLDSERLDDWLAALLAVLPERAIYIGWSLGGMLATALAGQHPERVAALATVASNLKFVCGDGWRTAMPAKIERGFYQGFCTAPEKTLRMFSALIAQGDNDERAALKKIRSEQSKGVNSGWNCALQLLAAIDNRSVFSTLTIPGLHMLGEKDALVPVSTAEAMQVLNPDQAIEIISDCGHAPHITQVQKTLALLQNFLVVQV
jgi:malonyl-CoA O-methyltransferase